MGAGFGSASGSAALASAPDPRHLPGDPLPFVYILGAGHSGSTLLAMLLAEHPRICTVGELKAPAVGAASQYQCSCGQRLSTCSFWRELLQEVERAHGPVNLAGGATDIRRAPTPWLRTLLKPLHRAPAGEALRAAGLKLSPGWTQHLGRFHALNTSFARAACSISGKQLFVDSSKTGLQLKYLLGAPGLDVKVIRLVRDGRGVALSYRTADGLSIRDAAYAWRRSNEEADAIVSGLAPGRWFDLRYERLCGDPSATMRALFTFVGVEPLSGPVKLAGAGQHVLGNNKVRLSGGALRLDEKWRRTLTSGDLASFEQVAGASNRRLGYS